MIKYTVLTYVPRRETPVACGRDVASAVRELGCVKCVVNYDGKLRECFKHKGWRILWAVTVEGEEEEFYDAGLEILAPQTEGLPEVGTTTGVEELVEV